MMISIIHPTKNRQELSWKTYNEWIRKADSLVGIQYILSVDTDDKINYEQTFLCDVLRMNNNSAIEAINNAAKIAVGDLIIVISDDFSCPEHWDTLLLELLKGKSDFLVKTKDGLQKTLITLPIMDRTYYTRFGYIYHPDYLHMHCDEEMTIVGHMLGRVITLDLSFPHNHYTTGKMAMDAINVKNNSTWAHGQATLDRRSKDNFGIINPLIKKEYILWK
ncbi:glycosyltransferase family protein [Mucilaginibacter xinganensis]|uniref:Glycosyltransferase 2-like domain-containing protein n=1 Tax=Mucilaginibacter xinganensis TaxID=1234841 RepID=A0A223NWZ7_9SPHI|nr:glycosyltransferase [Mucilaginibacter xinganensis]ASU34403.1 hypothetical protein MuYL_2516 [Mucilaginibacter xinganensis]